MVPKQIKIKDKSRLFIKWKDDTEDEIALKYLRDECPCAECKGETVLLKTFRPAKKNVETPGTYKVKDIKPVGGYAIQITWQDGHNTGIYSWEYLKDLIRDQSTGEKHDYGNII